MNRTTWLLLSAALPLGLLMAPAPAPSGPADESVFVRGLPAGQHESVLYVWTSDADQKDPDFLSVLDADPASPGYGKVIATVPTGSPGNEAHHFGYTANADRIFGGGLFSNGLFIYDVATDPRHPKLIKTIPDLAATTGYSGPHTFYAVPGGVMIAMLGAKDGGAPGALVKLDNDGKFLEAHPAPNYMYDVGVKPELNLIVTSSWAHPHAVKAGNTPMDQVGDEVVAWDWKTGKVLQVEHLDKSPLEVRWLHGPTARGGFINCAFGNSVWHWQVGNDGKLAFHRVIKLADGSLPADMRISYDNKFLFVSLFGVRQQVPVRVVVRGRRGAAIRRRRSDAAEAREQRGHSAGADDEAHARQQAAVREQFAALEPGRQGALPGAARERESHGDDARRQIRCRLRAFPDGAGAAA